MLILPDGAAWIKEALSPMSRFCIPTQFGPITLTPAFLHFWAINSSTFLPSWLISPNPAVTIITHFIIPHFLYNFFIMILK